MKYEKLAFGICWYDDPSILRLLHSLPKQAAKYVIDGRFKWNPSPEPLSNPHLRKKVSRFEGVTLIDAPDLLEPEKRQKYLDAAADDHKKYCLIIDSDEYTVEADWDTFYNRCITLDRGIHSIQFQMPSGIMIHPRLWVNPEEWAYYKCHCWFLHAKTGQILKAANAPNSGTFKSVVLQSDDALRSKQWMDNEAQYQKKLWEYETPLRR